MTKETILKNIAKWQEAIERLAPLFSLMAGTNA
jgi:hypothetical protein